MRHILGVGIDKPDVAAILLLGSVGRVMVLKDELRSGRHTDRHPLLKAPRGHARGKRHLWGAKTIAAGRLNEYDHVVSHRRVATLDFSLRNPAIFLEARIHFVDLVAHHAFGWHRE